LIADGHLVSCGSGAGRLPQGCYCGKVFIVDNLMVDLRPEFPPEIRVRLRGMAAVEDSVVKYLRF
jgi:hypothetical protein